MFLKWLTSGCRLNIITMYNYQLWIPCGRNFSPLLLICRTMTSTRCTVDLYIKEKYEAIQSNTCAINLITVKLSVFVHKFVFYIHLKSAETCFRLLL